MLGCWSDFHNLMSGKWKSDVVQIGRWRGKIFLYIDCSKDKIKIYYNFDWAVFDSLASYIEIRNNSLYFHNDDYNDENKMKYILTLKEKEDNKLNCTLTAKHENFEDNIEFTRLSQEEENKYSQQIKPKNSSRIDILKEYAEYGDIKSDVKFEFKFDERENMLDIIEKNNLDELVKGKNDAEIAIALMNWFCARYKHGNPIGGLANTPTPQSFDGIC